MEAIRTVLSKAEFDRIKKQINKIPRFFKTVGLESRLAGEDNAVDFSIGITKRQSALLSGRERSKKLDDLVFADHRWLLIQKFAQEWVTQGTSINQWVDYVFLEVDMDEHPGEIPIASIYAGLDSPSVRKESDDWRIKTPEMAALLATAELLSPEPLDPLLVKLIENCFMSLPYNGRILNVGKMLSRNHSGIRISANVYPNEVLEYLQQVGWIAPLDQIEQIVVEYGHFAPKSGIQLDFDITDRIVPKLGLGFDFKKTNGAINPIRSSFFLKLKTRGLATEEKAFFFQKDSPEVDLYHIKFMCPITGPAFVKAYFGVPSDLVYS